VAAAMSGALGWDERGAQSAARAFLDEASAEGIVTAA